MSSTQEIKSRLDIVDIVSESVELRRSGRNFTGFCPFHANTRTPAFYVSPEKQTWRCFGACAEGGDIFSFVMKRQGWDFKESLKFLAQKAGVQLEEFRPKSQQQQDKEATLTGLLEGSAEYFHQLLLYAPEAESARQYLKARALTDETIATFKIGFSLNSWDALRGHFSRQGYSQDQLIEAGLLTVNEEKGTAYDRFRGRIIFPINNLDGNPVGFGARTLEKDGIPKYLNSPQTPLFDKSRILYGLDLAKRHVRESRQAVIVEGYMDVIRAHQEGFNNVVAQMGTALTEPQLKQLKRFTKRFVIALDADEAGANAMLRGMRTAADAKEEQSQGIRGLLKWESPLKVEIKAVTLPEGKDPDDIIRETPHEWPKLLEQAQALGDYVIATLTRDVDLQDSKAKSAVAREIVPFVTSISDPVEQDHYWQVLSRALQTDERALRQIAAPRKRAAATPKRPAGSRPSEQLNHKKMAAPLATAKHETNYLCHCLHYPNLVSDVDRRLAQIDETGVTYHDFSSGEDQTIWQQLKQWSESGQIATIDSLRSELDNVFDTRIEQLFALPVAERSKLDQLPSSLALSVLNWRLDNVKNMLADLKQFLTESEQQGDDDGAQMHRNRYQELVSRMKSINRARFMMSSSSQRS